jgi:hypothetical protein
VLPQYTEYVASQPNTLLVRVQGFYRIRYCRQKANGFKGKQRTEYLMVMSNSLSYRTGFTAISNGNVMDMEAAENMPTEILYGISKRKF